MHIISDTGIRNIVMSAAEEAQEADRHARMLEDIYLDIDDLDPTHCPPDRRFYRGDKEAWVYDHGNICELVFVRREEE